MSKSNSQITTIDDAQAVAEKPVAAVVSGANHDDAMTGERVTVTIHPTDGEGGGDAVPVSVNGYAYQIPRGSPQSIPREVLEVLKNAKTTLLVGQPGGAIVERTLPRYSFQVE